MAEASLFKKYTFEDIVMRTVQPDDWWKSQADWLHLLDRITVTVAKQLLALKDFSHHMFRYIQNYTTVLVVKLAFHFKLLNQKHQRLNDNARQI